MATDLNMLLKAKRIELEASLDKGKTLSNIEKDLMTIGNSIKSLELPMNLSTTIKDMNENIKTIQNQIDNSSTAKSLKLKVELDANIKELNTAVSKIQDKIANSSTMKGVKIAVDIDVQGSAKNIASQLKDIQGTIRAFKGEYGGDLDSIQKMSQDKLGNMIPTGLSSSIKGSINEIKSEMKSALGDGFFSSTVTRDAEQNINGLVATFKKGTGEIVTQSYKFKENKFELISQSDVDRTEQNTHQMKNSITNLQTSLKELGSSATTRNLSAQLDDISKKSIVDQSELDKMSKLIKAEKEYQTVSEAKRRLINESRVAMQGMSETISNQVVYYEKLANTIDKTDNMGDLKILKQQMKEISDQYKTDEQIFIKREDLLSKLKSETEQLSAVQLKMYQTSANKKLFGSAQELMNEANSLAKYASELGQVKDAQNKFNQAKENLKTISNNNAIEKETVALQKQASSIEVVINKLQAMGKMTPDGASKAIKELNVAVGDGREAVEKLGNAYSKELKEAQSEAKKLGEAIILLESNTKDLNQQALKIKIADAIKAQDISALKEYISELKGAEVSTISLEDKTNKMGRAVSEIKVKMKGSGETVEAFTMEMDRAGDVAQRSMSQVSSSIVSNKNNSLGMLNQLGVAMKRVPTWILSMQSFYSVVRGAKFVGQELMTVNAEMTELARVAGDNINLDSMLKNSVVYAKELGGDFHAIMDSLGEVTRTFGDFNEQQLLAVNNTALIMDNVSDLSMAESVNTLIGTMNAFGIEAENTLHIVDAFNEVDNNFAISTQQIAKGMEKTASTASTFGVSMEQAVGQITAIGSVTMETGEVIGNSLKTIYSRITTHDGAIKALEDVGVAINKIGENGESQVRPVNDIMAELAGKWDSLSDAERQHTGVQVAGRNQLSRFLAVMNNWGTAVEATSTAYNSQNSAMKEQARYMDSYEAKINIMKTRFTELALSIGDTFAGDAIFLGIDAIGDGLEGIIKLVDKVGVLPLVLGGVGTAFGLLTASKGGVKGFSDLVTNVFTSIYTHGDDAIKGIKGIGNAFSESMAKGNGFAKSTGSAISAIGASAVGSTLAVAGLTAGFALLLAGVGFVIQKVVEQKKHVSDLKDQLNEQTKTSVEGMTKYKGSVDELVNTYDKLKAGAKQGTLSTEDQDKYNSSVRTLSEMMPNTISHVDALGETHLKTTKAIRDEVDATKALMVTQKAQVEVDSSANIAQKIKDYQAMSMEVVKIQREIENKLRVEKENKSTPLAFLASDYEGTEKHKQQTLELSNNERMLKETINEVVKAVGEKNVALLETSGKLNNVSLSAEALIIKNAQLADESLRNSGDIVKDTEKMEKQNKKFAESIATTYETLAKNLDEVDFQKASSVIDTFLDALPDKVIASTSEFQEHLAGIAGVAQDIATNGSVDVENMVQTLTSYGVPLNDAKTMVAQLGREFENQAIQTQLATGELDAFEESVSDVSEAVWEAIDPIQTLFGLGDGDMGNMESHINMLEVLRSSYGDTWADTEKAQASLEQLSDYFGVSTQYITENLDSLGDMSDGLKGLTVVQDEVGNSHLQFAEGTSQATQELLTQMYLSGDALGGFANIYKANVASMSYATDEMSASLKEAFSGYNADTGEGFGQLAGTVQEQLEAMKGSVISFKDANGELKLAMADGTRSPYLDGLITQLEEADIKVSAVGSAEEGFRLQLQGAGMDSSPTVAKLTDDSEIATRGLVTLSDQYVAFQNAQNEETKSTYLDTLKSQMEVLGEQISVTKDMNGELKLSLNGEENSPYITMVKNQMDELGIKITETKDKNGELKYTFKVGDEDFYFDVATGKVENLGKATTDAKTKSDELKESGKSDGSEGSFADKEAQKMKTLAGETENTKTVTDNLFKTLNDPLSVLKPKIDMSEVEKADESVKKTKGSIEETLTDFESLKSVVGELSKLIDQTLGKTVGFDGLKTEIEGIETASKNAKVQLGELVSTASSSSISIGGISKISLELGLLSGISKSTSSTVVGEMEKIRVAIGSGMSVAKPMTDMIMLRTSTVANLTAMASSYVGYSNSVRSAMASANVGFGTNIAGLASYTALTNGYVNVMSNTWRLFSATLGQTMSQTMTLMNNVYVAGTNSLIRRTEVTKSALSSQFLGIQSIIGARMNEISATMVNRFNAGTNALIASASSLPARIGDGIRANMGQATSAMDSLAEDMVTRFKSALGIHSPSRVFEELGGFVIAGLSNGLTGGDLKSLGQNVFKDFGGGIFDSMDMIKAYLSGDFSGMMGGAVGAGVEQWRPLVMKALQMTGQLTPQNVELMLYQMMTESGGNPLARNDWDINAINGDPSIGLMQVIGSTYRAYADPRWNKGQTDPLSSLLASIRYTLSRYGSLAAGWRGTGYANGGFVDKPEIAMHGEEGLEVIIPLIEKRRKRGLDLWLEAGGILGVGDMLGKGFGAPSAMGSMFGMASGESGEGSSGEGSAGIEMPSFTMPSMTLGLEGVVMAQEAINPEFGANASEMEALYKREILGMTADKYEAYVQKANTIMKKLSENTLEYRNQLKEIQKQEQNLLTQEKQKLTNTLNRRKAIENELKTLKNTGTHTEAQRKKYNELQAEFDSNTKSVWNLENSIEGLNQSIANANLEVYLDYIEEIVGKWDVAIGKIEKTRDALDFQLQKLEISDENDIGGQLKIQYDILEQNMRLEKTYQNQYNDLKSRFDQATKKYGENSKEAQAVLKELESAEKSYQSSVIERMKLEKELLNARKDVAKNSISDLKNYYKQVQSMSKQAIDLEKEELKKAHDSKMKLYDEEIQKINSVYDEKIKSLDAEKKEEEYQEKIAEMNDKRAKIMKDIALAGLNQSPEGKKALAKLQDELKELNTEISKTQKDRADEKQREELQKQKEQQLKDVEGKKETADSDYDSQVEALDKQLEDLDKYFKNLLEDDRKWKEMEDAYASGDINALNRLMDEMKSGMAEYMGGDFSNLSIGFDNLPQEIKDKFKEDNMMDLSNLWLSMEDHLKELVSVNKNIEDLNAKEQQGSTISETQESTWNKETTTSSASNINPDLSTPNQSTNPVKPAREHTIVKGDTLWDLAQKFYGNPYKWTTIANANQNPDPYKLQIGRKLVIPFDTGGYTGEWAGDGGRIALLHKKELVLNKNQTADMLDMMKVLEGAKRSTQAMMFGVGAQKQAQQGSGKQVNIDKMILEFKNGNMTDVELRQLVDRLMRELDKR